MQRLLLTYNRGRAEYRMDTVQYYRYRYNSGRLFHGIKEKRKGPISFKYNHNGDRITFSGQKTLLSEKELKLTLERYGPDERRTQDFNWHVQVNHPVKKKLGRQTYESFDWVI